MSTDIQFCDIGGEVPRLVAVEGEVGEDGRYRTAFMSFTKYNAYACFYPVFLYIVIRMMNRHLCLHSLLLLLLSVNASKLYGLICTPCLQMVYSLN